MCGDGRQTVAQVQQVSLEALVAASLCDHHCLPSDVLGLLRNFLGVSQDDGPVRQTAIVACTLAVPIISPSCPAASSPVRARVDALANCAMACIASAMSLAVAMIGLLRDDHWLASCFNDLAASYTPATRQPHVDRTLFQAHRLRTAIGPVGGLAGSTIRRGDSTDGSRLTGDGSSSKSSSSVWEWPDRPLSCLKSLGSLHTGSKVRWGRV